MNSVASARERSDVPSDALPIDELLGAGQPVVLRGLVSNWALVQAGERSTTEAMACLRRYDSHRPVQYSYGAPDIAGRVFYTDDFTAINCEVRRGSLDQLLQDITKHLDDEHPPTWYMASAPVDACLPGFREANDLDLAAHGIHAPPRIWIGNRTIASAHYDALNNIACCAVGRRRFTLFPPEQIANLYPGPLEPTPGGQAVSMVDFANPDFQRYPRFREALATAQSVELAPGDAVFIPSLWWHHVEGLDPFNVLLNYWWSSAPDYVPAPLSALYHALWTIRDRPEREKRAWREIFDYYVFGPAERAGEHLPEAARDVLGPMDEMRMRQLRAMLIERLNR
ncbi:MAG: cupin-like domain-containing protein [Pseudomonadota bacterium]|nr:cupin-like domain-containing protein [Pseudomonadota bacterium]